MKIINLLLFFSLLTACKAQNRNEEKDLSTKNVLIPVENTLLNADYHPNFFTLFSNNEYKKWDHEIIGTDADHGCCITLPDSIPVWGSRSNYPYKKSSDYTLFQPGFCLSYSISRMFVIPKNSKKLDIKLRGIFYSRGHWNKKTQNNDVPVMSTLTIRQLGAEIDISNSYTLENSKKDSSYNCILRDYCFQQEIDPNTETIEIKIENKENASLFAIENLDLTIDQIQIQEIRGDSVMSVSDNEYSQFQKNISEKLNIRKEWKIIGIGESIHGSKTLWDNFNTIIRHAIRNNAISLLLLEIDPTTGYQINQYTSGETDSINLTLGGGYFNTEQWYDFFSHIRKTNMHRKTPILVAGIDSPYDNTSYYFYLSKIGLEFPDLALKKKDDQFNYYKKMLDKFPDKSSIQRSEQDLFWFDYIYKSLDFGRNMFFFNNAFSDYDKRMAKNTEYLIQQLNPESRTYIWAHLGHLEKNDRKTSENNQYSMGYYLNNEYGRKYAVIGQFAASGKSLVFSKNDFDSIVNINHIAELQLPVNKSIELISQSIGKEAFYVQNWQKTDWQNEIVYRRNCGNIENIAQFMPFSLSFIDAFFFSRNNEPVQLSTEKEMIIH